MAAPRPIHEQFADEYQERGLQPHYKTQVNYRDAEAADSAPYQESYYQGEMTTGPIPLRQTAQVAYRNRSRSIKRKLPTKGTKVNATRKGLAYSRVTATNLSILSWGMTLWIVQAKFAFINILVIGLGEVIDSIIQSIEISGGMFGIVIRGVFESFQYIWQAIAWGVEQITGFNINFDLEGMLMVTMFVPFMIGLATLMIMGIQYQLARINCLSGQGAELKNITFILALIGYFIPIMNLIPWFIFWALAVWRYPK